MGDLEPSVTMVKPSELPFYEEPQNKGYVYIPEEPGFLEKNFKMAREGLGLVTSQLKEVQQQATHIYETGKAHSQGAYNQLLDEDNAVGRVGIIAGAGTFGLLVGVLRGRMVKRLLYTGLGLGAGAAVCYPEPAAETGRKVYQEGRRSALIGYNFVMGVPDPGVSNFDSSSSLIATSIQRVGSFLARKAKELYQQAMSSNPTSSSLTRTPPASPVDVIEIIQPPVDVMEIKQPPADVMEIKSPPADVMEIIQPPADVIEIAPPAADVIEIAPPAVEIPTARFTPETSPVVSDSTSDVTPAQEEISKIKIEPSSEVVFVEEPESSETTVDGDVGQSNPEDKDMYTTRGT